MNFNENSNGSVVALAIDSTATTTPSATNFALTLTNVVAAGIGGVIVVGFDDEGQPIRLTLDADLIETFTRIIAGTVAAGSWVLVPAARNTAANLSDPNRIVAGGRVAASNVSRVDHVFFIALDEKKAAYDEVPQGKNRVQVGLDGAFGTGVASGTLTDPSEGAGYAKDVLNYYRNTEQHRKYIGGKDWQAHHVEYGHEVVSGAIYDTFIMDSCHDDFDTAGLPSVSLQRTVICVQNLQTPGFTGHTGTANAMKAEVQTAINNWMNSTDWPHTNIAI